MTTTAPPGAVRRGGVWIEPLGGRRPQEQRAHNLQLVADLLERHSISYVLLRTTSATRYTVAVSERDHESVVHALSTDPLVARASVRLVRGERGVGPSVLAPAVRAARLLRSADVLRVFTVAQSESGTLTLGEDYGCDVEFWEHGPAEELLEGMARGPRPNVASSLLPETALAATEPFEIAGRCYPRPTLFRQRMLEDVTFPVDVVYTWVDGGDPAWRERMLRARAEEEGRQYHPEAAAENRYMDREELRYSLRSLQMYAPWVNHVYIVTDDQVPPWLRAEHPGLTIIDHRDIFDDHSVLPVFNSNAIISRLHHIEGLNEHYLYLNDDMFFGRDVRPEQFFHASGVARLFPARLHRPFGAPTVEEGPHFNLTRNIRALLEREFGITVTRAIRHTPYPQLRSAHFELEKLFPDAYRRTTHSRFRHHDDIVADQLLHYYLQITGGGAPSGIRYDYVNVGVAEQAPRLARLLRDRDRSVFCLNDAPEPGKPPMPAADVLAFLEAYFPVRSDYEL
ncbi:MAG: Stealth CR1 domain-containing protein [Angustibacter sp.]